jgi:radical SAM superfamily enzyme YgiQ (UPF0313 family)
MPDTCKVLLVAPLFNGRSFWNLEAACEIFGSKFPCPPLGLITVAALLPKSWECRLINRNTEELTDADLDWADLVMTGGMLPQRPDTLTIIALAQKRGRRVVLGGPDATSSPEEYSTADFLVLGEAEGIIDDFVYAWLAGSQGGRFEAEKFKADVTKSPLPRFDLLKRTDYLFYGVQFARGCPFTCEFCDIIELFGRNPRVKTSTQMLAELDLLFDQGYRGHLDFVDDNFIGNKKAVKAFLAHLIAWQKDHGYPFEFSTEASINIADDDALLALMREANFFAVFVGIESPDTDTLVSMQKKQNTRRELAASVHKLYRAGMFVTAGFIVGFDSERGSVAQAMIDCIEETSIPAAMVGLLYALPGTQLTRRLAREGRLFPANLIDRLMREDSAGDQCTAGLNYQTARSRRDILRDYRQVLESIYRPAAYFGRVTKLARMLDRPALDRSRSRDKHAATLFGIPARDILLFWRLASRMLVRQPLAFWHFAKAFFACARNNPRAIDQIGTLAALYLHYGPFSRYVMKSVDQQISDIDAGKWVLPQVIPVASLLTGLLPDASVLGEPVVLIAT